MKSSMLILFTVALAFSVECTEDPEPLEEQEGEFQPRFLAVFLETDGGSWDDSESETETKTNFTGHAINDVLPQVQNHSMTRMKNILGNLTAVDKFENVLEKLGYSNDTSEDTAKFKNILSTLENSTLSNSSIAKVEEILGKISSGEGFAMYRV